MKKLLGIIVLGLLTGCFATGNNYNSFKNQHGKTHRYFAQVKSPSSGRLAWAASNVSFQEAINLAIRTCRNHGSNDCIPHTVGNRIVYQAPSREDINIAKAKNVCTKLGVTPGTDRFTDCTIKMMSTSTGQQSIIIGQQRQIQTVYPLHCRQMGGMSNC